MLPQKLTIHFNYVILQDNGIKQINLHSMHFSTQLFHKYGSNSSWQMQTQPAT